MTALFRCNSCNKETTAAETWTLQILDSKYGMAGEQHACSADDAVRLAAPLMRKMRAMSWVRLEITRNSDVTPGDLSDDVETQREKLQAVYEELQRKHR